MSWELFRIEVLRNIGDASKVPSTKFVAEVYANAYDACIKRGGDLINRIPVIKGNKELMKQRFLDALEKGLLTTTDYDLVGEMGKGVIEYWRTAELAVPNPPLPSTKQIASGVISNLTASSNKITNPGQWQSQSSKSTQPATDSKNQTNENPPQNPADNKNKKILIVGDSISVDVSYTWSGRWKAAAKDLDIEILAKGAQQLIEWMKPQLEARLQIKKYDKVYIYGGVNDAYSNRTLNQFLNALQSMVDNVVSSGAEAVVIVGYDGDLDMDTSKMSLTRYVKSKEEYDKIKPNYIAYQAAIPTSIKNATIVPKITLGVLSDGFHPYDKVKATKLYQHISKY